MKSRLSGAVSACLFTLVTTLRTSINATIACLALLVTGCLVAAAVNAGSIHRANLDGSGVTDLVTGLFYPRGIALDVGGGQMYWTESSFTSKIQRANLDGSGVTDLVTGLFSPRGIALDAGGGQMYWTDHILTGIDKILRANLDGSGVTDLLRGLDRPVGIALDVGGGQMYWTDTWSLKIQRANLDGSGVTDLVTGLRGPTGIALDVGGGHMYWTESTNWKIQRANLDGSGVTDLLPLPDSGSPTGIALDVGGGQMYWTGRYSGKIQRANLDGSGVTDVVTGLDNPLGIALDLEAGHIYFTSLAIPTVDLSGTIKTPDGTDICAMVLASGRYTFSCTPPAVYSLSGLPLDTDFTVKRQIYADGFFPKVDILADLTNEDVVNEDVVMTRSGVCPSYNTPHDPGVFPDSAGKRIEISGLVLLQDTQTPICAMVLANGRYMFSCDGTGSYALSILLDNNGQFKLQVYADGFAPAIQAFDEFQTINDVRMARAVECQ